MALYFVGWGTSFLGWEGSAPITAPSTGGGGVKKRRMEAAIAYNRRRAAEAVAADDAEIMGMLSRLLGAAVSDEG